MLISFTDKLAVTVIALLIPNKLVIRYRLGFVAEDGLLRPCDSPSSVSRYLQCVGDFASCPGPVLQNHIAVFIHSRLAAVLNFVSTAIGFITIVGFAPALFNRSADF